MNTPHEFDSSAFDDRVRSAFDADDHGGDAAAPTPSLRVWQGLQPHLLPPMAHKPSIRPQVQAGLLGLVAGMLMMLGLSPKLTKAPETHENRRSVAVTTRKVAVTTRKVDATGWKVSATTRKVDATTRKVDVTPRKVDVTPRKVDATPRKVIATDTLKSVPASAGLVGVGIPTVLLPLVGTEQTQAGFGADSALTARERRRDALLMQRAALARLQFRTDSLLLALGEPMTAAVTTVDSTPVAPLKNRWSVALSFAPERNFFGLNAPAADTLAALRRTHEQGRGGWNAALMAEYRLDRRWSVGAGAGVSSYGAELRLTDHRTTITTKVDTITSSSTVFDTVTTRAWAIRRVRDSILAPIVNFDNQIIGYEYLPTTRLDTVWTNLINTQAVTTTTQVYKPTVTTRQETSARILRPNYRFLTVPVVVRYRLGRAEDWTSSPTAPRWWADVAVGTQLQFFLGGTQITTRDGLTYQTERIGARNGPFRPLNLALTGAVAFNYALTPRLSASLAPTIRHQLESVYKASTNLTQKPTATGVQLGVRYAF